MQLTNKDDCCPRCALIVGHPGHELRVWGWLRTMKPVVAVLTDGSGHGSRGRLDLSLDVFRAATATPSALFGATTDREFYGAILRQDVAFFLRLSDALAEILIEHRIECVAGDAIEGYNPTHDLCRLLIDRAVRIAFAEGSLVGNYEFGLVGHPKPDNLPSDHLRIDLSSSDTKLKLAEIRRYATGAGGTLFAEVEDMMQKYGKAAVGQEFLMPADAGSQLVCFEKNKPFYEAHGEKQVAAGYYRHVIRYHEHVVPIARALRA